MVEEKINWKLKSLALDEQINNLFYFNQCYSEDIIKDRVNKYSRTKFNK